MYSKVDQHQNLQVEEEFQLLQQLLPLLLQVINLQLKLFQTPLVQQRLVQVLAHQDQNLLEEVVRHLDQLEDLLHLEEVVHHLDQLEDHQDQNLLEEVVHHLDQLEDLLHLEEVVHHLDQVEDLLHLVEVVHHLDQLEGLLLLE